MKKIYKLIQKTALGSLGCMLLSLSVNAQRPASGGGSSTSASSSSNSSRASSPSPSPSPSVGSNRPASVGYATQSSSFSQSSRPSAQQSYQSSNGVRSNYGFTQRQGVSVNQTNNNYQQRQGVTAYPGNNNRQGVTAYSGNNNRQGVTAYSGNNLNYGAGQGQNARGYNNYYSNGVTAYSQRAGITATGFRSNGYHNADYWGNHDYYHYNRGYYSTYYQPRLGFSCYALPYGYYPFYWGDYQYYYSDGLFYQYNNEQYTVVEPPIGAEVTSLPSNAQSIVINGQQYYEAGGVYYQPYTKDDGTLVYVVAGKDGELNTNAVVTNDQPRAPQIGDLVNQLPPNCRKVLVNGQRLFVSVEGIYFQEKIDENGIKYYKIVGLPTDDPDQN